MHQIKNIATVNAFAYFANESYSAAKAGVVSLTRSIAVRYGSRGLNAQVTNQGRDPDYVRRATVRRSSANHDFAFEGQNVSRLGRRWPG